MPVTRSIGTKIRRRVASSTTRPSTRGGLASTRSGGHEVADLADALAVRAEHGEAHQPRDEDARGGHAGSLMPTMTGDDRRRADPDTRR